MHERMNEHTLGSFIQGSGGNEVMSSLKHLWGLKLCKDVRPGQNKKMVKVVLHTDPPVSDSGSVTEEDFLVLVPSRMDT